MAVTFTSEIHQNLVSGNQNIACCIEEQDHTYADIGLIAGGIQKKLNSFHSNVVGVLTQNKAGTYASIVAAWLSGRAYVPVNPAYPAERNAIILQEAGISEILHCGNAPEIEKIRLQFPHILFIDVETLQREEPVLKSVEPSQTAYILFTSGTTGKPKGVPITFGNIQAFLDGFNELGYTLSSDDRFLQMFELTFDLSVMSFAVPLCLGASFYTLPQGMIKTLGLYHILESKEITFSLMVPSAIQLLAPYLDDIELPHLRISQFCGEALKTDMAEKWSACIPNAIIDNVYGPTEATIYCTRQQILPNNGEISGQNGIAGIGKPMQQVITRLFLNNEPITEAENIGELCLAGAQLTPGYLNNPEQNAAGFFEFEGTRFYRTGDLALRNKEGNLMYCGRIDDQVKIQGFRIELAELEYAAKKIHPLVQAVAVGVRDSNENWTLALFVQYLPSEPDHFQLQMRDILPEYMVPHHVIAIDEFPMNSNGKTDRNKLREMASRHK